jgi:putative nucleotidyltransferase with HDIG domain
MHLPSRAAAEAYLRDAGRRNPGPWVEHSRYVARAAELIARRMPALDAEAAHVLGLLHDIGRREGVTMMRHIIDGYRFMVSEGFPDAARICLTHSFPIRTMETTPGAWDCTAEEYAFVAERIAGIAFDGYDRLLQLCDSLALPNGFCLLEKRFVDVTMRYGFSAVTVERWQATLALKRDFEAAIGAPIYALLPGVAETTFETGLLLPPERDT